MLVTIASVVISIGYTPWFEKATAIDSEIISLFPAVKERMIFIGILEDKEGKVAYSKALYAYGSIYHNITTAVGWSPPLTSTEYLNRVEALERMLAPEKVECEKLKSELAFFNTTEVIATQERCQKLAGCGLREVQSKTNACLYKTI